jgi:hypothetical protein
MKRSERFLSRARRNALSAAAILSASVAGCVWSVALVDPLPSGGMLAAAISAAGLCAAAAYARECAHNLRMAGKESRYEYERSIRPRI